MTGQVEPGPYAPLSDAHLHRAAVLWADGKNTAEIASDLQVWEARVFNSMGQWMPRARRLREWRSETLRGVGKTLSVVDGGRS